MHSLKVLVRSLALRALDHTAKTDAGDAGEPEMDASALVAGRRIAVRVGANDVSLPVSSKQVSDIQICSPAW